MNSRIQTHLLICCDQVYHDTWVRDLVQSVRYYNAWLRPTVVVVNPDEHFEPIPDVRYHIDRPELTDDNRVAYLQAVRFVKAAELFDPTDAVMSIDADSICLRAIDRRDFIDLCRQPAMLWHVKQANWLAGMFTFGMHSDFAQRLREHMLATPVSDWPWGYDQLRLRELAQSVQFREIPDTGKWITIGKIGSSNAAFLTLKGNQKIKEPFASNYQAIRERVWTPPLPRDRPSAFALEGPWLPGLPLPELPNIQQRSMNQVDPDFLPDLWIIHNNTENKRTKRNRSAYDLVFRSNRPWIVVESPALRFNQGRPGTDSVYYRWSWFSFFQDTGIHYRPESPPDRWQRIQQEQQIEILPWQPRGDEILFMMQRPGDSSNVPLAQKWGSYEKMVHWAIKNLRRASDRPISIRLHPLRQGQQMDIIRPVIDSIRNVQISRHSEASHDTWVSGGSSLYRDLDRAWAVVGGNSNGLTEAACYGVPTWCLHASAMAWPVSQGEITTIEEPRLDIDRSQWLANLGYCQWRADEIRQGLPWHHLMQWWPEVRKRIPRL